MWTPACSVCSIMDEMRQIHMDYRNPGRKRDDTATLSVKKRACPVPCLDRLLVGLICIGIQGIYIKLINHCQAEMIK